MTKNITVKDGQHVSIEDFKDLVDIDRIVFYRLNPKKDGTIHIKFYDKKKKLVRPYERK
jgi:hypothetical protein